MRVIRNALALVVFGACVPPDDALPLGGVAFELRTSRLTRQGIPSLMVQDGWTIRIARALLSYKTVTIGRVDAPSVCAYRGRAAQANAVFDAQSGVVQSFNGVLPDVCPDVGLVFGPPDGETVPVAGATGEDILELAAGSPAHALVVAVATRADETYRVVLRFDTARTSSRLAGCRAGALRGVRIVPNEREQVPIAFAADAFFRESLSSSGSLRFAPFVDADRDADHVVTMAELDALPLSAAWFHSDTYPRAGFSSFGDYLRAQFKSAFFFRESGTCTGKDPGDD
jgi:hypothetical protein